MLVHGAMPIDASFDDSTDDRSLTSASSYVKTTSSWPSEFSDTDHHSSYFSPEYLMHDRDRLILPNKGSDQEVIAPNGKYLGFDESSSNDNAVSPGDNICDPLSPTASGEYTESTSYHLTVCLDHFHVLFVVSQA
jgi:hypothetical protein